MYKLGNQTKVRLIILICVFLFAGLFAVVFKYKFFFKADENAIIQPTILSPTNNSRFTYVNNPLIQGTATPNASLDISYDGTTLTSVTVDSAGHFYYKPDALNNGVHTISVSDKTDNLVSAANKFKIEYGDDSKSILKSEGTQIIENDHPYYGNGANNFGAIVEMMGNPDQVEEGFANDEKAGIKMIRVINYMLDDMKLPDPTAAPTAAISDGGTLSAGSYVYRYTCANLSKTTFAYDYAETLASPATGAVTVSDSQKVSLTLKACAQSYRYLVYRRNTTDAVDSETYLGFAEAPAGQDATFIDDGSYRPSGIWADPTEAPTLETQARNTGATTTLEAGDYIYRYAFKEQRKPVNGKENGEKFVAGNNGTFLTLASPTAQVTVSGSEAVKVTVPTQNSPWAAIYRRKSSDLEGSEKFIAMIRSVNGVVSYVDEGVAATSPAIPTSNSTAAAGVLPTTNETKDNPRTQWPTGESSAYMTGFGNWNEDALVAADKVMALAQKYNVRIMFTFLDQHDNNTGGTREIARNCATTWNSSFFNDACSENMTDQIINKFLNRTNTVTGKVYKDDPAIFAWELVNEPFDTGSGGRLRSWINKISKYEKSIDPNHMLSSGDDGSVWFTHNYEAGFNANNNHDFVLSGISESIDLLTWHGYPESSGFVFNHGYYGQFDPTDSNKRGGLTDAEAADWIDKYGPVGGPIDVAGAIKQLKLRSHYATLMQKPVVFGEWGVDWTKSTSADWITGLSDAILDTKSDVNIGSDIFPDGTFQNSLSDNWHGSVNFTTDSVNQYNGHNTMKISFAKKDQTQYLRTVVSKKITVKPNTKYWYTFVTKSPTIESFNLSTSYYNADGTYISGGPGNQFGYAISNWEKFSQFNSGYCEFTTPSDATQIEFAITIYSGTDSDYLWLGDIHFYELTSPTESTTSAFASTGWWGVDLSSESNLSALQIAANKFEKKMFEGMTSLTEGMTLNSPTTNLARSFTYKAKYSVTGTKSTNVTRLIINGSEVDVPADITTWTKEVDLPIGTTTLTVIAEDSNRNQSEPLLISLIRRKSGDSNNDSAVNIKDFSNLMSNWNKTEIANTADFNEDNKVNISDFSIMMSYWGK
ncbi:MAG: dockerin type I domain-containing protein [Patescibacteria group bacterium]